MRKSLTKEEYITRIGAFSAVIALVDGKLNQELSKIPSHIDVIDKSEKSATELLEKKWPDKLQSDLRQQDGVGVILSCNRGIIEEPLRICHITSTKQVSREKKKVNNTYIITPNAHLTIVEEFWGAKTKTAHHVSSWIVESNGKLEKYTLGDFSGESSALKHIQNDTVLQYKNSCSLFYSFYLPFGPFSTQGKHENNINATLREDNANCDMRSISFLSGEAVVNNTILMRHEGVNCQSSQLYKGIYSGGSRGLFDSCVVVEKGAQEAKTKQKSDNLLLSSQAAINTNPKLEIFADNVECAHGATTGQLDQNALFYLASRGITANTAQNILLSAFISDIIESIPNKIVKNEVFKNMLLLNTGVKIS